MGHCVPVFTYVYELYICVYVHMCVLEVVLYLGVTFVGRRLESTIPPLARAVLLSLALPLSLFPSECCLLFLSGDILSACHLSGAGCFLKLHLSRLAAPRVPPIMVFSVCIS